MSELLLSGDAGMMWGIKIFAGILNDRKAFYMSILTYFDVFMCLWSYIQTIRIKNNVVPLRDIPFIDKEN
jgi:hypothetical protein